MERSADGSSITESVVERLNVMAVWKRRFLSNVHGVQYAEAEVIRPIEEAATNVAKGIG